MSSGKIDLILPWVDDKDPLWRAEKDKYDIRRNAKEVRFESWDNLQFVLRGIEKYMPWVNRVFLVTYGHLPPWLDTSYERLQIVKHRDYIPQQYLPTFNSNVIEMNYFRINELSENYILFNDDIFILQPISEEYYFVNNLPCEEAVETHFILKSDVEVDLQMAYACVNNMVIINKYFNKRDVVNKYYEKWFNPVYGERMRQNLSLYDWNSFESFVYPHEAMPMKKSILKQIWELESEKLDTASYNKFRSFSDITQRLVTIWQICSGQFVPHKYLGKLLFVDNDNCGSIAEDILNHKYPIVCLSEIENNDFDYIKTTINNALNKVFPEKSRFER